MRISDWSSDVCSSDLAEAAGEGLEWPRRKLLVAEENHQMVEERLADRGDAVVRERRRQVGPGDLGPDRSRDRRDGYGAVSHAPTLLRCRFGEMLAQLERRDESRARS